jgi:hypothetical protein
MNDISYQICIEYYQYFYSKISGSQGFEFRPRRQERVCIENFVEKVKLLFGVESLFNYLSFAFSKYEGLDTNRGKNNIPCSWVFGQKTFKEYLERDHERSAYWVSIMMKNYRIKKGDLIKEEKVKINIKELNSRERKRFTNKERQLIHCLENNLYNRNSVDCIICVEKKICVKTEL